MEQTKRVIDDYPADSLPDDLRGDIASDRSVRVTIEDSGKARQTVDLLRFAGAAAALDTSADDAVKRVRELRDDWR